tara:strand:+ start:324 stop:713 length:390 start_codon:yes stop_codon:yes gene_type:complete
LLLLDSFQDVILISCGAVLGANTRYLIYKKLKKINISKNFIVLLINILSSFLLGLFLSTSSQISSVNSSSELVLFFSIGLLGSFSTFSSFIYDLYDLIIQLKFYNAFKLFIISLTLGLLACAVGFLIGM